MPVSFHQGMDSHKIDRERIETTVLCNDKLSAGLNVVLPSLTHRFGGVRSP